MNRKSVKTNINQLVKQLGSREAVSAELGISTRYIRMLQKNEKKASFTVAELIRLKLK